jgi:hypothetical protein
MAAQVFGNGDVFSGGGSKRYEYCRLQADINNIRHSDELLAQLGQAGWELVAALESGDSYVQLWLQREVQ